MKKRMFSALLALCLLLPMVTVTVQAAGEREFPKSGAWGAETKWSYDETTKTMTISKTAPDTPCPMGEIYYSETPDLPSLYQKDAVKLVIEDGITSVGVRAFRNWTSLEAVELPESVVVLRKSAFEGCRRLTEINIPDSVRVLENSVFTGCSSLKTVTLPEDLIGICNRTFEDCSSLEEMNIPKGVKYIGPYAFAGTKLTSVTLPEAIKVVPSNCFSGCASLKEVTLHEDVLEIENGAFSGCASLTDIKIPGKVRYMGSAAFANCTSLVHINIPAGARIWRSAFSNCSSLTDVEFDGKSNIFIIIDAGREFSGCTGLKKIEIPEGTDGINLEAFSGCTSLEEITLPSTLEYISTKAFENCPNLKQINYRGPQWQWEENVNASLAGIDWDKVTIEYNYGENFDGGECGEGIHWSYTKDTNILYIEADTEFSDPNVITKEAANSWSKYIAENPYIFVYGTVDKIKEGAFKENTVIHYNLSKETLTAPTLVIHELTSVKEVSATCTTSGSSEGYQCSQCDFTTATVFPAHDHVPTWGYGSATCQEKGKFSVSCQYYYGDRCPWEGTGDEIDFTGPHIANKIIGTEVKLDATCIEKGYQEVTYECKCGKQFTVEEFIACTGHEYGEETETITEKPTCITDGKIEYSKECKYCGDIRTRYETIPANGHTWGEWTVTKEATATETGSRERVCSVCNEKQTETIPATEAHVHTWGAETSEITKAPTCTEKGVRTYTKSCGGCAEVSTRTEEIPANGHTWGEWKVTKEATADQAGSKERACTVCGEKETEAIPATGVKPDDPKPEDPAVTYYSIYTSSTSGGSYDVSHRSAAKGTRITIELNPRSGYELDDLRVTNRSTGQSVPLTKRYSDEYYFTMPASSVDVDISFSRIYAGGVWYDFIPPRAKPGPTAWYYRDRHIYHVTTGLVPDRTPITRDMLISVLYNMTDGSLIPSETAGSETNDAHVWATQNGIIPDIYASGLWGTDKSLSREQAVMLVFNYARHQGLGVSQRADITRYSDYSRVRPIARDAMSWAAAAGLMRNTSDTLLSPRDILNCGQIGDILYRFGTAAV